MYDLHIVMPKRISSVKQTMLQIAYPICMILTYASPPRYLLFSLFRPLNAKANSATGLPSLGS